MKFFHISDLHLGLKLRGYNLIEDQKYILNQIIEHTKKEQIYALIIAGDIYDRSLPPAEAVELFDKFITDIIQAVDDICIMAISGNHDSPERINIFRNILKKDNVHMIGMPPMKSDDYIEKVVLQDEYGKYNFYLLPYVAPHMAKNVLGICADENISYNETIHRLINREDIDVSESNILVSHQFYNAVGRDADKVERADSEYITVGNIDEVKSDVLEPFDYAALGHIHMPSTVGQDNYRYCGSPIGYSMSEREQEKSIVCVDIQGKNNIEIKCIPLKPIRNVKRIQGSLEEVLEQACGDYVEVELKDETSINKIDARAKVRDAFPYLLNIRWSNTIEKRDTSGSNIENVNSDREVDPFTLCKMFLNNTISEDEENILKDIINEINAEK